MSTADEPLRVLLLDDRVEGGALARRLEEQGLDVRRLERLCDVGRAHLARRADVVLLQLGFGGAREFGALDTVLAPRPPLPVVATGSLEGRPDLDLEVIERGAEDFLAPGIAPDRAATALRLAAVRFRSRTPAPAPTLRSAPRIGLHPLWKLEPGTVVDRYEIERILGRGGMAVVYRVRHVKLGSVHALKVVLPMAGEQAERLMMEGQAQARLRHANLVGATDVLELDPGIGLVMEYVEGPTLQDWMTHATVPARQWLGHFRGIVRGLRHAHGHGLVHRDLKPANVLLMKTDEGLVPKVADFGIAKNLLETMPGDPPIAVGTVGFAAPEQYAAPDAVDPRADLFSLGCLLVPLACGVPAFPGREPREVIEATRQGRHTDPREIVPELPDRFVDIVGGLLEVEPGRRTPDCQTLLEQMDELDVDALPDRAPSPPSGVAGETLDAWALEDAPWTTGWQPATPPGAE